MIGSLLSEEVFEYEGVLGIRRRSQIDVFVFLSGSPPAEQIRLKETIISTLRKTEYSDNEVDVQLRPGELVVCFQAKRVKKPVIGDAVKVRKPSRKGRHL